MTDKLLPCPLCGAPGESGTLNPHYSYCTNKKCPANSGFGISTSLWDDVGEKLSELQAENERYKKALENAKTLFLREVEIDAIHSVTDENAPEETFKRVADSFRIMALLDWDNDINRIINHKDNDDD